MTGMVGILNVGAGDTKITFDPKKPDEMKHATRVVTDMIRLGYAVMVPVGIQGGEPVYRRAKAFDAATCEYIVMGVPEEDDAAAAAPPKPAKRSAATPRRYRADRVEAVSISRSAGG